MLNRLGFYFSSSSTSVDFVVVGADALFIRVKASNSFIAFSVDIQILLATSMACNLPPLSALTGY